MDNWITKEDVQGFLEAMKHCEYAVKAGHSANAKESKAIIAFMDKINDRIFMTRKTEPVLRRLLMGRSAIGAIEQAQSKARQSGCEIACEYLATALEDCERHYATGFVQWIFGLPAAAEASDQEEASDQPKDDAEPQLQVVERRPYEEVAGPVATSLHNYITRRIAEEVKGHYPPSEGAEEKGNTPSENAPIDLETKVF